MCTCMCMCFHLLCSMTKLKEYSSEICHLRMGMMILLFLMRMTTLFVINCKTPTGNSRTLEEEHVNDEKVVVPEDDGHHVGNHC